MWPIPATPFQRRRTADNAAPCWDKLIAAACERFGWTIDEAIELTPSQLLSVMEANRNDSGKESTVKLDGKEAQASLIKQLNKLAGKK